MASTHTIKAFDHDLEEIRARVAELGGAVEAAVALALDALLKGDDAGASRVIAADATLHRLSEEIERQCIRTIALRAPLADDLRVILASFKISVLLERMGDCARNIAEQVPTAHASLRPRQAGIIRSMSEGVAELIHRALDAFARQDAETCRAIHDRDAAIDSLQDELSRELLDRMATEDGAIVPCTSLLLASVRLERIGHHAAEVGKVVFYGLTGDALERRRASAAAAGGVRR